MNSSRCRLVSLLSFIVIAALSGLTVLSAAEANAPSPADETTITNEVLAANARMVGAANRLDLDAFFGEIVDSDQTVIVQNGVIFRSRRDAHEAVKRGLTGVAKIDRRFINPKVSVLSANAALLVSEGDVTATLDDGRVMDSRFAVSLVFVRQTDGWKLLHGHYSMLPDQRR